MSLCALSASLSPLPIICSTDMVGEVSFLFSEEMKRHIVRLKSLSGCQPEINSQKGERGREEG